MILTMKRGEIGERKKGRQRNVREGTCTHRNNKKCL